MLQVVSRLLGSWLGFVDWDGQCYWDINRNTPHPVHRSPNPLPSDSRYRLVVMIMMMTVVVVMMMICCGWIDGGQWFRVMRLCWLQL